MTYQKIIAALMIKLLANGPIHRDIILNYVWKNRPSPKGYQTTYNSVTWTLTRSKVSGKRQFTPIGKGFWV